jgi:hypothetical protein
MTHTRTDEPELMTLASAARVLGVTTTTAKTWLEKDLTFNVPVLRLGGRHYVPRRAFEAWLDQMLGTAAAAA